jgi:ADP-ribose pyrophosphatase YjhB (NUDIX family)
MNLERWSTHLRGVHARGGLYLVPARVELAVGVVLVVRNSLDEVALIQKAAKEAYEFSNLWAFPGGMVRGSNGSFLDAVESSLRSRVGAEIGLGFGDVQPLPTGELSVTSYNAKGSRRFVLVLPFTACADGPLHPADPSIGASRWFAPSEIDVSMAPANLLVLCRYLEWRGYPISEAQIDAVDEAKQRCEAWRLEASD